MLISDHLLAMFPDFLVSTMSSMDEGKAERESLIVSSQPFAQPLTLPPPPPGFEIFYSEFPLTPEGVNPGTLPGFPVSGEKLEDPR